MRSDPGDFDLVAPENLEAVVTLLAKEPGIWLPIAGGTDVMVLYGAGTLTARKLVSIWNLPELRRIDESPDEISVGAACTYTDLREHRSIVREFPLLARAASWTGGIANQNRGTLGGNIANASPAADSLPALLVYDAELTLVSIRGERRIAYRSFHTGYKKTAMAADEIIRAIHLKKKFGGYVAFTRKVGARSSQAIAKVSIAALGRLAGTGNAGAAGDVIEDVRIALGSVAPVPLRLDKLERELMGRPSQRSSEDELRQLVAAEISPIIDIRSTAEYRAAVACNLVMEFLYQLRGVVKQGSGKKLARWNGLLREEATQDILACCGAQTWAATMAARRPFANAAALFDAGREVWRNLSPEDWLEAFRSHPRIGERHMPELVSAMSQAWSSQEQSQVAESDAALKLELAEANRQYEARFGRIFIACATAKSPEEILGILRRRMQNDDATELREAAEQQEQIMQIRLRKWLEE